MLRFLISSTIPLFVLSLTTLTVSQLTADERTDFFESRIRPLLLNSCVECHGPDKQEGNLRLDSREQILNGSTEVDALVQPGNSASSRLMQVVLWSEDDTQMPPKAKLTDQQIGDIRRWIEEGAVWPETSQFGSVRAVDPLAWKRHWAFQPIPAIDGVASSLPANQHPIDHFIRVKLTELDLYPSPRADNNVIARRLSFAIKGLPPEPTDEKAVATSVSDYVNRLLNSPQFGERWARYWLDVSRYADTKGYVFREDREYKEAWKYREWVINAINTDMPYDEFLKRQLAADQFPESDDPKQLAAMGFLTLGRRFLNNKHDIIDDRIDLISRGTMGLTVACARCHDHKFDPISQADYYSLYGIFDSSDEPKNEPSTLRLVDRPQPREPVIFLRGNPAARGEQVPRRFLTALSQDTDKPFANGSGRMELAEHIASPDNPLTARVAVNRVWLKLFGQGLVESPSDFGVRSAPPTHPELLDYLASYLISTNWSMKSLIRHIVTSETYLQSSHQQMSAQDTDPENRLLSRMNRLRLDFEAHRDSLLTVSGHLDTQKVGGPSVDITAQPFPRRRTVYARIDRQNLPGVFRTFDFASPDTHAPRRFQTTVPQQALFQMNNPFVMEQAEALADSVCDQIPQENTDERIGALFQRILNRSPENDELNLARSLVNQVAHSELSLIPPWQYGYGEISIDSPRVIAFNKFPRFHNGRWQGSEKLPDSRIGWTSLTADGGHSGGDLKHCPIRRWTSPVTQTVAISSVLKHSTQNGDGVQARIINAQKGQLRSGVAHNSETQLLVERIDVAAGDIIDFVIDCRANESHDSFTWQIRIQPLTDSGSTWDSARDFGSGLPVPQLNSWGQLAQALMMSNEFVFID